MEKCYTEGFLFHIVCNFRQDRGTLFRVLNASHNAGEKNHAIYTIILCRTRKARYDANY